jgi:hypothetical protein
MIKELAAYSYHHFVEQYHKTTAKFNGRFKSVVDKTRIY